jgi:hypothetical protein
MHIIIIIFIIIIIIIIMKDFLLEETGTSTCDVYTPHHA